MDQPVIVDPAPLRLAVGLGDPERERALLPALSESGEFVVAERCLAADQLLACLERAHVDAALVASCLHRLNDSVLDELARTGVPLVLLASSGGLRGQEFSGVVLPLEADAEAVRQALVSVVRGDRPRGDPPHAKEDRRPPEPARALSPPPTTPSTIVVASGHGSPGRTTVALNLAVALGAVAPAVLVDADLAGPSLAACLDADPTRNLFMISHAAPETPRDWERALAQETQPLASCSPHGVVLCGVPKPEMRNGVSVSFFERLVAELQQRYRYVVLDVGADLLGPEAELHRAALRLGRQLLLVASADLVGLWHARTVLGLFSSTLQIDLDRTALIINGHDRRYHHGRTEIEWALGIPTAAVIPYDHGAAQRALAAQQPLVLQRRSRAARALLDLAERVHGGIVVLPPEPRRNGRARWLGWASALRLRRSRSHGVAGTEGKGAPDGRYAARVR